MTTKQSRTLYDQYIEATEKAKEFETKRKDLLVKVLAKMDAEKIYKAEGERGIVTIATKAKWTYSENVTTAADQLKDLKKVEEKTGVATKEEVRYLVASLR
jgi:hypothetical protein